MIRAILISPKSHERQILKDYFSRLDYSLYTHETDLLVEETETGIEALDRLRLLKAGGGKADIIICSDNLADMDAVELAEGILQAGGQSDIVFFMYTASVTMEHAEKARNAGVKEILVLPFTFEIFHDSLTRVVDNTIAHEDSARTTQLRKLFEEKNNLELEEQLRIVYSESLKKVVNAQKLSPWSYGALLSRAKIYCGQNEFKSALPLLKRIVNGDVRNKMAQELLMLCYKRLGKAYEDTNDLKLMVQQNPGSSALNQRLGETFLREGEYDAAIAYFTKAIDIYKRTELDMSEASDNSDIWNRSIYPGFISACLNLITLYKKIGEPKLATETIDMASRITPTAPEDWLSMFQAYLSAGDDNKAKYSLKKALHQNQENQQFLETASEAYVRQGNYKDALEYFERLKNISPADARIYNFIGICNRHLNRHVASQEGYHKALELDPSDAGIHFNKGAVLEDMNYLEKALESYQEAFKLDPMLEIASQGANRIKKKMNTRDTEV